MGDYYDISKTFKTTQKQLTKIQEVEKIMGMDQSEAIRFLMDVGYAGVTSVRSPGIVAMKDDGGLWNIPLLEELSPEAREATFEIWEKELGTKVDWIRRANEKFMKRHEKDYENLQRVYPIHKYRWGAEQIISMPPKEAKRMVDTIEINLTLLKAYAGMEKEYELRHGKRLPRYGPNLSPTSKGRLLYECLRFPGHEYMPSIVAMATKQKARVAEVKATT